MLDRVLRVPGTLTDSVALWNNSGGWFAAHRIVPEVHQQEMSNE
jgi:hypothetical protein